MNNQGESLPQMTALQSEPAQITRAAGKHIRAHRVKLGLTAAAFGALAGVSERTQRAYESGQRPPDLLYLAAAARQGLDCGLLVLGTPCGSPDPQPMAARAGAAAAAVAAAIHARGIACPPETVGRIVEILCIHHWPALANPPVSAALVESLVALAVE